MKKGTLNKILLIICLVIFAGCKARKAVVVNRNVPPPVHVDNTLAAKLAAIRAKQTSFNTFSARAKTQLDINGDNNDVTLNIRVNRDKMIWLSVTAILGIEIARAVITPDSIQIMNKLQGLYIRKPFSFVHKYASKQIDYGTLQSLLVGNTISKLLNDSTRFEQVNDNTKLSGKLNELLYKLILGPDLRVTQTSLASESARQSLQVTNNVFILAANKVVPSQIDIASVVKNQKIQVNLRYNKVDFDQPLQFPFRIPDSYSPAAD